MNILKDLGKSFCLNIIDFTERDQKRFTQAYEELNMMYPKQVVDTIKEPIEYKSRIDEES